jgi:hypothetical protein
MAGGVTRDGPGGGWRLSQVVGGFLRRLLPDDEA